MKGRRIVTWLVAVAASAGLVGAVAPGAQAAPAARAAVTAGTTDPAGTVKALFSASGFQALIDSVTAQVRAQYPNAVLMEIDGRSPSGPTKLIKDVTEWRFDFNARVDGNLTVVYATVNLPSWTATIVAQPGVFVGSLEITTPVTMSPFEANVLLRTAGYWKPFEFVTYRQPIAGSFAPHLLYIFNQGNDYVSVDTVTKDVAPIR